MNGHPLNETRMEIMGRQRFFVEVTLNRATVEACNLLGTVIPARVLQHAKDLLIGYGVKNAELPLAEEIQVHYVNLREIDVRNIEASELRRLLIATADRLLCEVYCQPNASLANVLEELSEGKSSDVRIAQAEILEAAGHYLRQFGVRKSTALRKVLEEYEMAAHRRAEEQVARERGQGQLDGDQADIISQRAQDQLRKLLETDLEARNEILDGVRHKLTDNRYHPRSILFELFQNADDAYAELGSDCNGVFVVEIQSDVITIMHEGRRINHPGSAGPDTTGHTRDLRKMLSLGHSDKGFGSTTVAVTGRFGLGFKSVFLFTDRPLVVSGRLTFEVLGAVYPRPLGQAEAEGIRLRLSASGMSSASGTAIRLTPRLGSDMLAVTEPFHQLAHILIVFARRIRQIRYSVNSSGAEDLKWMEIEIAKRGASRVTTGILRSAKSESGPRRVVVIRTPTGDVLFGVCSSGFTRTHQDIPTVWVTAPTGETCNIGFVVNAAFILDVGRAQVDWTATANRTTVEDLAQNLGDGLLGLYEATSGKDWPSLSAALQLTPETSHINLWCSLWEVISDQRTAPEILKRLFWAPRTGAAARLYTDHDALPTGLAAEGYQGLTSLTSVQFVLKGTLDQRGRESLQSEVAKWSSFQNYHRGTVVSYREIWSVLRALVPEGVADLESIDLAVVLKAELQTEVKIDPLRATRFGNVLNPAFFRELAEESAAGRDETERLHVVLRAAQFRTQGGTWAPAAELLLSRANKIPDREDELLRSGFAPADAVLSDTYSEDGTKFFYICRGEMSADAARLVKWAIVADTSERRRAVLNYLLRGEHRRELADRLSHEISNCWLGSLSQTDLLGQFSANDRIMILACLGLYVPLPPTAPVPQHPQANPIECLQRIAEWWQICGEDRLAMFDLALYPLGRTPKLTQAAPGTDPATRREWLTLFIAGILTTSGRTKCGQIREFLRLSSDEGWLDQLTDPKNGPAEWLASVQRFIDRQVDEIPRYHRLRQFVGIATVARYLEQYVQGFLEMDRIKARFSLKDILTQRTCQHFQGTDLDAPPLGPILGYGACFVVRELARTGIISSNRAYRYCFPPARSLRSFLTSIGWVDSEARTEAPWTRSRSIYAFLREHVEQCPDPTFGKAFDIPLLLLAEDEVLARKVLGDAYPVR